MQKTMIILTGPESTGTRILTDLLSQHPQIHGPNDTVKNHTDACDVVWELIEEGKQKEAENKLQELLEVTDFLITRRSLPHGLSSRAAEYMRFPNFEKFVGIAGQQNCKIIFFVTYRSVIPNLMSWSANRQSARGNFESARKQYHGGYLHLFSALTNHPQIKFYFVSVESLLLDGVIYIESLFNLLGLSPYRPEFSPKDDMNKKWYNRFFINGGDNQKRHGIFEKMQKKLVSLFQSSE